LEPSRSPQAPRGDTQRVAGVWHRPKVAVDNETIQASRPQGLRVRQAEQDTIKTTVAADAHSALLWCGSHRPGRMHDTTAARVEGIAP
jgi:hypothetical protein